MKKKTLAINARRELLGNPYAFMEQLEHASPVSANSLESIREARLKLQNQYAYLDGNGGFSAAGMPGAVKRKKSDAEIEVIVRQLQRDLWLKHRELWLSDAKLSPLSVLDPAKAAEMLGYRFEILDSLGAYQDGSAVVEVAGTIDRESKTIRVSREFDPQVQSFTAAHELGHLVLHPEMSYLHRDRGASGVATRYRDVTEQEADKFAALFLMPGKLVLKEFQNRFLSGEFMLEEETAFALMQKPVDSVKARLPNRRALARHLASTAQYNGRHFYSLADLFGVTTETMAIRIEELGLVKV